MNEEEMVRYAGNYDENAFWKKLKKFGRKAGIKVTYGALLLFYVLKSPGTSSKDRAKILISFPSPDIPTTWQPLRGASTASSRASPPR